MVADCSPSSLALRRFRSGGHRCHLRGRSVARVHAALGGGVRAKASNQDDERANGPKQSGGVGAEMGNERTTDVTYVSYALQQDISTSSSREEGGP